jgi:hypothetical protein
MRNLSSILLERNPAANNEKEDGMTNTTITKTILVMLMQFLAIHCVTADECLVINRGFEESSNIIFDSPDDYGYWAGNYSQVVGVSDGITPVEGSKMLHFIHAAYGDFADESMNAEIWQIIDISTFVGEVSDSNARAWGEFSFNRVAGDPNTDTEFFITLQAFIGDPCSFDWEEDLFA